jgi:hypothetical protein
MPERGSTVRTGSWKFDMDNTPGIFQIQAFAAMSSVPGFGTTFPGLVFFKTVGLDRHLRGGCRGTERTFRSGTGLIAEFCLHLPEFFLKMINPLLLFQATAADIPP